MKFGKCPVLEAENSILGHSIKLAKGSLKKGRVLDKTDIVDLQEAGHETIVVATLEDKDVHEDVAVYELATSISGENTTLGKAFTGRCNLHASDSGLLLINEEAIDEINLVDEALTIASLEPFSVVAKKEMIATVKSITFSIEEEKLHKCIRFAEQYKPVFKVVPFSEKTIGFIQTRLPATKESVLDKTTKVLTNRLNALNGKIAEEIRCEHDEVEVSKSISTLLKEKVDMIIIAGASAVVDRRDVIPLGVEQAGGAIRHFGMPVDPGNLLLLAEHGSVSIIGMPGCARSPKENGFDMVLERLMADLSVERRDIMRMGVGGLLKEMPTRIQPREGKSTKQQKARTKIASLVLAAGQSSRMGKQNKLLLEINDKSMLEHVVTALKPIELDSITVVTGHESKKVEAVLENEEVNFVHNPDYASGISTSLIRGLESLDEDVSAVLVCLGDMPLIRTEQLREIVHAFNPVEGREICVPTYKGKRGNPVLWSSRFFSEMKESKGDTGARRLLSEYEELVCEVPVKDSAVLVDFDTQQALTELNQKDD